MRSERHQETPPAPAANGRARARLVRWLAPALGFLGLIWFLVRVVPKPSRATYPCQRVAFPLASGFVVWLLGLIASLAALRTAWRCVMRARYLPCGAALALAGALLFLTHGTTAQTVVSAAAVTPNAPIGTARGLHPGRVVWIHDPGATDWEGPGNGYWWERTHTDQAVVDTMMDRAIKALAGEKESAAAWDRLFRHFNKTRGRGDVPYKAGEKITVKVNFVGCIKAWDRRPVTSLEDYRLKRVHYMNTSPQVIMALLRQLRDAAGVTEADITVGDTLCYFPNEFYDPCHREFPAVRYLDCVGTFGRTRARPSTVPLYWSTPDAAGTKTDHVPLSYAEADYLINLANLKSHNDMAGITLCAKNHYGSLLRTPIARGLLQHAQGSPLPETGDGAVPAAGGSHGPPPSGRENAALPH